VHYGNKELEYRLVIRKSFLILTMLLMLSTIALTMGLFLYVAQHDFIWLELYGVGEGFVSDGIMSQVFLDRMADVFTIGIEIPKVLDMVWLLAMVSLFMNMCYTAYNSKREGFYGMFTTINYMSLFVLYIANYYFQVSDWIYDLIINKLLMGINFNAPFYTYYLDNFGVITLVMIGILMLLNFVDFDLNKFNIRKEQNNTQSSTPDLVVNDEI